MVGLAGVPRLPAESLRELLDLAFDGVNLQKRREGEKRQATSRRQDAPGGGKIRRTSRKAQSRQGARGKPNRTHGQRKQKCARMHACHVRFDRWILPPLTNPADLLYSLV